MINKKASAVIIVLVVSVLIVSSGIIITNEVKKSNNENSVAETGLFLLDNEQSSQGSSSDSDSSNVGTEWFSFDNSEEKSYSKKKSSSGTSSSGDSSDVSGNPETIVDNINIPIGNETFGNQTVVNDTEENQSLSESADIGAFFSDGQIFEENGTAYIVRDSVAYILASSSYYIKFDPLLPSSVCENERIDIIIKGDIKYNPTVAESFTCTVNDRLWVLWDVYLMEADAWPNPDDEVKVAYKSGYINYPCDSIYFEHTFENVDLSDWIIPDSGGNGEFYAKAEGDRVTFISTSDYGVSVDYDCECLSGPCCYTTGGRPYVYKVSGSQPTGKTDYYYCSGANSPTGTNYCEERDYYCSGNSAGYSYSDSTQDTCGICEYCIEGDPTCNYYSSSTKCGTRDCDYLDTTCRNYNDADRFCKGNSGTCKTASCTSYTDTRKHTSCGTNKECDGSGICITCTSHARYSCYLTNVYWYDACDNREDIKEDCGTSYESDWKYYCVGDDKWKKRTIFDKGCDNGNCYTNRYDDYNTYVETCQYGCTNGNCKSDPNIECSSDRDCGTDGYSGNPYCSNDDVYESLIRYTCNNPGTIPSYCSQSSTDVLREDCGSDESGSNYCSNNDVYRNFTDRGCSEGSCFENATAQFVEDCGTGQCVDGMCEGVEKPDLTVTDLVVQYISGRTVTLAFTVKNLGELAATNIYWMVDTDSTDTNPERTVAVSLDPGGWTRAYMMWTYSRSGTYQPEAIVDFGNVVSESNENNNRQSVSVSV